MPSAPRASRSSARWTSQGRPALRRRRRRRRSTSWPSPPRTRRTPAAGAAHHGRGARRRRRRRRWPASARSTRRCSSTASRRSTLHRPIPVEGTVARVGEITGIYDKGKGAVVVTETGPTDVATGEPLFTTRMSAFIRGEGGWGGDRGPSGPQNVAARARARPRGHLPDPPRPGADLPPVGRPQPAALRPVVRGDGRLRPADPPRPVHLRLHRPGAAPRAVRRRPGPVHARWRAASRRRCSRARRSRCTCGTPATARRSSPRRSATGSSSTRAR